MELAILDWIHLHLSNAFLDWLMPFISLLGNSGAIWIMLAVCFLCTKKYRKSGVVLCLALLFAFLLGNVTLKPLIGRLRPFSFRPDLALLIPSPQDFSFPSGHTMSSFAAAAALWKSDRLWGWAAGLLASAVAFSRLYLYVHFPSDVLAGILLGLLAGWLAIRLSIWLTRKIPGME